MNAANLQSTSCQIMRAGRKPEKHAMGIPETTETTCIGQKRIVDQNRMSDNIYYVNFFVRR
ncbi:hypothetical protein GCM10025857_01500 [Alicyclobacillus contaminans]|nr:hypothetical protein GCM10025857_01500 [Alicyclobacillus contaminans]